MLFMLCCEHYIGNAELQAVKIVTESDLTELT